MRFRVFLMLFLVGIYPDCVLARQDYSSLEPLGKRLETCSSQVILLWDQMKDDFRVRRQFHAQQYNLMTEFIGTYRLKNEFPKHCPKSEELTNLCVQMLITCVDAKTTLELWQQDLFD